jgi:hypothetical protein
MKTPKGPPIDPINAPKAAPLALPTTPAAVITIIFPAFLAKSIMEIYPLHNL